MSRIWAPESIEDEEQIDREHRLDVACNSPIVADSSFNPEGKCPKECPFFAEDHGATRFCTFQCVTGDKCAQFDPFKPIPDEELGVCRGVSVDGCKEPRIDGTDRCAECARGYELGPEGRCYVRGKAWVMPLIGGVVGIVVALLVIWIVDLCTRPTTNQGALDAGLYNREETKIMCQKNEDGTLADMNRIVVASDHLDELTESSPLSNPASRSPSFIDNLRQGSLLWRGQETTTNAAISRIQAKHSPRGKSKDYFPITTNLCYTDVAGPGITLHFNFQAVIIVWVLLMAAGWLVLGFCVDTDLFVLGSRSLGTPPQNCFTVAWGYETQHRLMWAKVLYLWVAYISSFLLALLHSIRQMRIFECMDNSYKTMQDYAIMIEGLPEVKGDETVDGECVEDAIKREVKKQLGLDPVGVSVAWNYKSKAEEVEFACKQVVHVLHDAHEPRKEDDATGYRKRLKDLETTLFLAPTEDEEKHDDVRELISGLTTSNNAFLVFHTEAEREEALQTVNKKDGFVFKGSKCIAKEMHCEPTTVLWSNFDRSNYTDKGFRCFLGCFRIAAFLGVWFVVFYLPYAWSIYHFDYSNGRQPGFMYGFAFSMIVVVGNNIMYNVCDAVSSKIGYRFKDDKEAAYMVFYTVACTMQILLDFVTTYHSAWHITKGLKLHTYDGRPLSEVDMYPEGFETYAIQRALAENTYDYAFPSTFLIPFILEPFVAIIGPLILTKAIIRTHKEVRVAEAEDVLAPVPLEMSRYGDIMLDIVIFIMILYFPGAYTAKLGVLMAACHVFIYCYDHYRVLRVVPNCTFASLVIDWWAQAMLAPCCAILLSILVYKANVEDTHGALQGPPIASKHIENIFNVDRQYGIIAACALAFFLHCVVHMLLLIFFVPLFKKKHEDLDRDGQVTYKLLAERSPNNWFNANPVHCLRSKYLLKHDPPCIYMMPGREDLQQVNEKEGLFFNGKTSLHTPRERFL